MEMSAVPGEAELCIDLGSLAVVEFVDLLIAGMADRAGRLPPRASRRRVRVALVEAGVMDPVGAGSGAEETP